MKGPFGLLLVGGGIVLLVGLFTGKITFPGASSASSTGSPTGVAIPGKGCPAGQANVAGICQTNPHNCPSGSAWSNTLGKCLQNSIN